MEEKIQNLITTIWEQSLNLENEELIIKKLNKICFQDPLRKDQIIFICSRIINSEVNLLKYLEANCGDKERKSTSFRKKIIDFIKELIENFRDYCVEYLEYMRNMCSSIYISEQSLVVKEKILSLIAKIISHYETELVAKIYKPQTYLEFLLDEIKLKKLSGSIKGGIWHIIGILVAKYSIVLNDYKIEIHDVLFHEFKSLLSSSKKFEFKAATGILKSYLYLLDDPHLTSDQINQLYIFLKTLMKPLNDANSIKINKLALEVISSHGKVFFKQIQKDSINLFDDIFELCNHYNQELKMAANEAIEKISMHISECLMEENDLHKDAFKYLIIKIKTVLDTKSANILVNTAISLIGIFANAIVRFMGENILEKYLEELIVLFDQDIINALGTDAFKAKKIELQSSSSESGERVYKPSKSIKYVLYIQKQYISLLNSYSNIISNLSHVSELVVNHFYKILLISFSTNHKFYEKYKDRLSDSIAGILVNMFKHQNFFWSFLRKLIKNGFIESIKLTSNMIFKENIESASILTAVKFWIGLINRDNIFTEYTVTKVFNQLMTEISDLISSLNIKYKEIIGNENNEMNSVLNVDVGSNNISYEAEDVNDLEIYNRSTHFLKEFMKSLNKNMHKLFSPWILILVKKFCHNANSFPRVSASYSALAGLMKYSDRTNFFSSLSEEKKNFLNEIENFNQNLIKKIEIFQDDLLLVAMEFLLSLPTVVIKIIYLDNIASLKYIFKKAFQIGYNDIRYAKYALNALENWLEKSETGSESDIISVKTSDVSIEKNILIKEILPIFGEYLIEYEKIKQSIDPINVELIEKYNNIQNKIFKILGEIGGEAHNIIDDRNKVSAEKNDGININTAGYKQILNIMNSKNVEYSLPLYNKKYKIYFDNILTKIADYAQNSFIKEKKYASAELLHSLILYVIGLEIKKEDSSNTNILTYLIEYVLNLACDLEKGISIIFETLLFQIIHWMAKKGSMSENKDIIALLDIIIENTSSKKNLKLRELSSQCVAEYIKWFIKQHTDITVKEKSATIKYIIRRIESNAQHPDCFKRLGAVLCFEKIMKVIALNDSLVDKFLIEIAYYCIMILKISHYSDELNEIIYEHLGKIIESIIDIVSKKIQILIKPNPKRSFFKDIFGFWQHLMEKFLISESECRYTSQYLWIKIFQVIRASIGFENPKQYFYLTKNWPQLTDESYDNKTIKELQNSKELSTFYHFLNFMFRNKIIELNDLSIYYPRFSVDKIFKDLKAVIEGLLSSDQYGNDCVESINAYETNTRDQIIFIKQNFLCFIYIVNMLHKNEQIKESFLKILKDEFSTLTRGNLIENILILFKRIFTENLYRKMDVKCFIFEDYDNLYLTFLRALEKFIHSCLECLKGNSKEELIFESFLLNQIIIFRNLSDKNNVNELLESPLSDGTNEFSFNILIQNENKIENSRENNLSEFSLNFSSDFFNLIKSNFKVLLSLTHPKFKNLIKCYFNFIFIQDFKFITDTICENQYNFDFLADLFFDRISHFKISKSSDTIKNFLIQCCISPEKIFLLFILLERSTISKLNPLIDLISEIFLKNIINFSNKSVDAIINQIKIANLIIFNALENFKSSSQNISHSTTSITPNRNDNQASPIDLHKMIKIIHMYLHERQINIVKEIVNLLGLIVKLISTPGNIISIKEKLFTEEIRDFYLNIQSRFFPIKTKYLKLNTKEFNDFQLIYNSFLNTFKTVKSFEFMELLFPIIREENTEYSKKVKICIKEYIHYVLSSDNQFMIVNEIQKVIDIFTNKEIDRNLRDNIRFTLMKIVCFKFLKKCEIEILKELFIRNYKTFEAISKQNMSDISVSYENKFLQVLEKTIVFKFFEICFQRLPTDVLKNDIHKKIYGDNSQGNELTKILILELHNAKRMRIPDWDVLTKSIKIEEIDEVYCNRVENKFYCSAYVALSALIKLTQTKEEVFVKFLFQTFRDKNEKLWELLVTSNFEYNFTVETNFITKELHKKEVINNKGTKGEKKLLIDEIVTDSFFHDAYGKTLKETLVSEQKNISLDKPNEKEMISKLFLESFSNKSKEASETAVIEEDMVNKHPIMESVLTIIEYLHQINTATIDSNNTLEMNKNIMPAYLQHILFELKREENCLNLKIFFIKLMINKSHIFEPHLHHFLPALMKYSTEKQNGGKGFHYYHRDVATLIISSNNNNVTQLAFTKENVLLVSNYINALIKLSGDTKNIIFRTNLKIISDLMDRFKHVTFLYKKSIVDMLKLENKTNAHIWKISAVQILASAMDYNIPINDEELFSSSKSHLKFINSLEKNEEIFPILFKLCEYHRTPVQSATVELLAKLLNVYSDNDNSSNKYFNIIFDYFENLSVTKSDKLSINLIFRTSLHFRTFLKRKKIFSRALSLFKNSNQNNRNLLIHTFNNFLEFLIEKSLKNNGIKNNMDLSAISDKNFIDDIYYDIYELIEIFFVDPNDDLLINLITYLSLIVKAQDTKYNEGIILLIQKIQKEIIRKDIHTRAYFYDYLMKMVEEPYNLTLYKKEILNMIISNLDREKEPELKRKIIEFLNSARIMPQDPVDRLIFLMENLTEENVEEKLIQTIAKLLLILSENSADYKLKVYEKSLAQCEYRDLNINTVGYYLNRSQPVAPSVMIRSTLDEAYETIINISQKDALTQVGYLRSTQDLLGLSNSQMVTDSITASQIKINNSKIPSSSQNNLQYPSQLSSSMNDLFLSQHSSLISVSQNYPSMHLKNSSKTFNLGKVNQLTSSPNESNDNNRFNPIAKFKVPLPKKRRGFGNFLTENEMLYTPLDNSQDSKIRFVPDGSYNDRKKHKEEMKDVLIKKWIYRRDEIKKKQVKLMRHYRVGDLPDIQINHSDLIDPLILLCDLNLEISSELFLEIMNSVYLESFNDSRNVLIQQKTENLLKKFKISNFLIISCLHRFMLNMMGVSDEYIPDLYLIKKTGLYTKNYHSAILIFEEFIINNSEYVQFDEADFNFNKNNYPNTNKIKKISTEVIDLDKENKTYSDISISQSNKAAWINLLTFYSKINLNDYEAGLIQNFSYFQNLFIKSEYKTDFLSVLASLLTKSKSYIKRNEDIAHLLKATFKIYEENDSNQNIDSDDLYKKYHHSMFIDADFKETIEEYSIKFCSDLGEWENISNYLKSSVNILTNEEMYSENPDKIEDMLKSWIYTEDSRRNLSEFLEEKFSNSNENSLLINKENPFTNFVDETFTHYMSLYYIMQKDYDRALLYFEKAKQNFYKMWLNLGGCSGNLKHVLVNKIQKLYEISEFLEFIRGNSSTNNNISLGSNLNLNLTNEGAKNISHLFEKWLNRWPNYIYDDANVFQEIYSERKIFFENFSSKFTNFVHIVGDNTILNTFFPRSHIKMSTIMIKKDFLDIAENHTKKALKMRKDNSISNSFIVLPVLRNKYKILEVESCNKENIEQFNVIAEKYEKLIKVLNDQVKNINFDKENKERLTILSIKMHLNVAFHYLGDVVTSNNHQNNNANKSPNFNSNSNDFLNLIDVANSKCQIWLDKGVYIFQKEQSQYEGRVTDDFKSELFTTNYTRLLRPIINFSDKILRRTENKAFNAFTLQMSRLYVENSLKALIMEDHKEINTIPKILDLLSKHPNDLNDLFENLSDKISPHFFLKWKNQLIAYISNPISKYLFPIVDKILKNNPQSLFFPFSVIEKYSEIFMDFKLKTEMFYHLKKFYSDFTGLNSFVEALDGLTNPEHRLKFWIDNLKEIVSEHIRNSNSSNASEHNKKTVLNKIKIILDSMNYDMVEINKRWVGNKLGSYNLKFSKDFEKLIKSNLNLEKFENLLKMKSSEIIIEFSAMIDPIVKNLSKTLNSFYLEGIEKLSTFSEFLAQYECTEFTNSKTSIEMPLENYDNSDYNHKKVYVSSFDQHLLILPSIRRPKRITIFGNDEKSYMFLVKGGEDIRLDQRIMEVFKAFNEIINKDSNCRKKNLKLNHFFVFPLTVKLGLIEWVKDTQPMKNVIKYSMNKIFKNPDWDLKHCPAQIARLKWLQGIASDKSVLDQHFIALHSNNIKEVSNSFLQHENLMPKTALKKGLEHYLLTPEEILTTRINFITNYSALSVACYILGIGDRHLDNFLINIHNSEILAIDFGVSFGQGLFQVIPELVPFRFTSQIRNVIYPFGKKGIIRQTMIDTLSAFKNNKDYILDYCEVFIKEPLLDWIKLSRSKLNYNSENVEGDMCWLPVKRVGVIENKLNGMNPISVMLEELSETRHSNEKTMSVLKKILYGDCDSIRSRNKDEKYLEVEDQIDILIEQASDPNLLGRMWVGWSPFI